MAKPLSIELQQEETVSSRPQALISTTRTAGSASNDSTLPPEADPKPSSSQKRRGRPPNPSAQKRQRQLADPPILPSVPHSQPPQTGMVSANPSAHFTSVPQLLATKSNLQLMTEGNHDRLGLSFPTSFVTDVNVKRINHSDAERSRRDRLRSALEEMHSLLHGRSSDHNSPSDGNAAMRAHLRDPVEGSQSAGATSVSKQSIPKAQLVEMAIERIRIQERELKDAKQRLEDCQRRAGRDKADP